MTTGGFQRRTASHAAVRVKPSLVPELRGDRARAARFCVNVCFIHSLARGSR